MSEVNNVIRDPNNWAAIKECYEKRYEEAVKTVTKTHGTSTIHEIVAKGISLRQREEQREPVGPVVQKDPSSDTQKAAQEILNRVSAQAVQIPTNIPRTSTPNSSRQ